MTNMQCRVCLESYFSLNMKTQDSKQRQPTLMSEAPAAACEVGNDCSGASELQSDPSSPAHCWLQSLWEPSFGVVDCRERSEYGFWGVASFNSQWELFAQQDGWIGTDNLRKHPGKVKASILNKQPWKISLRLYQANTGQACTLALPLHSSFFCSSLLTKFFKQHKKVVYLMGPCRWIFKWFY